MIIGINTSHEVGGKEFHIQCEDLGNGKDILELRVYQGGNVIFNKRVPYSEEISTSMPVALRQDAVREKMKKLVATMRRAIDTGKLVP